MIKSGGFVIIGLCCFIFLVFAYGRMGTVPFDKSIMIVISVFLMAYSARAFEVEMKYKSPKFVSDPVHSTVNWSDCRVIGNYAILPLGAFQAYGFHYAGGNEGTAIIRLDALNKFGESAGATCKLTEIKFEEMPPEIFAEKDTLSGLLTEPIYRGDIDNQTLPKLKRSDIAKIQAELIEKDKYINMQKDLLDGKFDSVEKFVEGSSRIIERKKGVGQFLRNMFIDSSKNDNDEE